MAPRYRRPDSRLTWCPPLASQGRRQGVVPASIKRIREATTFSSGEGPRADCRERVGEDRDVRAMGGAAQDQRSGRGRVKGRPDLRRHPVPPGASSPVMGRLAQPLRRPPSMENPAPQPMGDRSSINAGAQSHGAAAAGAMATNQVRQDLLHSATKAGCPCFRANQQLVIDGERPRQQESALVA